MTSLFEIDWAIIDEMVEKMVSDRAFDWKSYNFFIVNDDTVLVKIYTSNGLAFVVKAKLNNGKLEVVEVS